MRAWAETDAPFSLYMDVDLSTELEAVPRTVALLLEGADLVTGSRLDPQANIERSLKRELRQTFLQMLDCPVRDSSGR